MYLCTACFFTIFFQRSFLYFPSKEKIDVSYFIDSGLKEIELITSDELVLKSWFKKPSKTNRNTFLVFHGNTEHIGHRVEKFQRFINEGYGFYFLNTEAMAVILASLRSKVCIKMLHQHWNFYRNRKYSLIKLFFMANPWDVE